MLSDWYFCCCINAHPATTHAFLSILEILENHESSEELLDLAIDELLRTEIWMQVYALPAVLKARKRKDWLGSVRNLKGYFANLLKNTKDARHTLDSLINNTIGEEWRDEDLKNCAVVINRLAIRKVSATPYLDLKEFLPETMILAIVADRFSSEVAESEKLLDILQDPEFEKLLDNALDYQFGRLAFRLAAQMMHWGGKRKDILLLVAGASDSTIALEPDLLNLAAEVIFLDRNGRAHLDEAAKRMIYESWTFAAHQQFYCTINQNEEWRRPLGRLRLQGINNAESLALVYWQTTLWELAARIAPTIAARELADLWIPPGQETRHINFQCRFDQVKSWEDSLRRLSELHTESLINFNYQAGRDYQLSQESSWLFRTPWVRFKWSENRYNYPAAQRMKTQVLVRLIASVKIAIRLLQEIKDSAQGNIFAALVTHGMDVITSEYGLWLDNYFKPEQKRVKDGQNTERNLVNPLTGLALFGRSQATVQVQVFLRLFRRDAFWNCCEILTPLDLGSQPMVGISLISSCLRC